jgi:hypothetical protein
MARRRARRGLKRGINRGAQIFVDEDFAALV